MMGKQYIIPFLIFSLLMNLGVWFFSDKIAIASMHAKEVGPQDGGDFYRLVEELARRAQLPMPRVYIAPHDAPNAFATGRSPRHSAVCATQGALQLLNREELEGVMAHELAHIKNRDTLTSTIAASVAGVLATLAQYGFLLGGGGRREGSNPLVALFAVIFAAVGAALIKAAISRSREFVADADGAAIAGSPQGLMSALAKLETYSQRIPMHQPNPAMNNMFIVEPLMGKTLVNLFATHPPTQKRIEALSRLRG
jgi:heat shock protein HtpX